MLHKYIITLILTVMAQEGENPLSPVDVVADEALCPTHEFLNIVPNNHYLDPANFRTDFPVVVEILRRNPLFYVLNETAVVPLIYVQQLWQTLELDNVDEDNPRRR